MPSIKNSANQTKKRINPTMITFPDGEGVIMSGGFITCLTCEKKHKEYLTEMIELRLDGTGKEFYWTMMDQTMKVPRELPVMFAVSSDYCLQPDFLTLGEHASVTLIGLTIAGVLGLVIIISIVARRYWKNKIQTSFGNELSPQQIFEENSPTYEQIHGIEINSLPQLFMGNIEKGDLIGMYPSYENTNNTSSLQETDSSNSLLLFQEVEILVMYMKESSKILSWLEKK